MWGGASLHDYLDVHDGYKYFECELCGSIVLANIPNVQTLYSGEIDANNAEIYIDANIFNRRKEMISKPKYNFIQKVAGNNNIIIETWVDIGCGSGELLCAIRDDGQGRIKTIGIESDKREIKFAKDCKSLNIIEGYVDVNARNKKIEGAIKEATVVSLFNVLEHIENPRKFVDYLYENMSSESLLVLEVPRHPSLASFANITALDNIYRHIIPPVHLQVFTEQAIGKMLADKFDLLATWGFGQGFTDLLTNAAIISKCKDEKLYNSLMDSCNDIQKQVDENGFSDAMIFIAQRK